MRSNQRFGLRSEWLLLPAALCATIALPTRASDELPPVECVTALRAANIEHLRGDEAAELAKLLQAAEPCEGGVSALSALLQYHRRVGLPPEVAEATRQQIAERFTDEQFRLPLGLARQLSREPDLEPDFLQRLLAEIDELMADASIDAATKLRALRVRADLQQRLGLTKQYGETLQGMRALQDSKYLAWQLFRHHLEEEDYGAAADVLADLPESEGFLRSTYLRLLAQAGRVDEVLRELAVPTNEAPGSSAVYITDPGAGRIGTLAFADMATQVAWHLRDAGRDDAAEQLFRRALAADPKHQIASKAVAYLYGTSEERIAFESEQRPRDTASNPAELANKAADLMAASQYEGAYDLLRQLSKEHPTHSMWDQEPAWYNFGIAAYRSEQWQDAERAFNRAVELNDSRYQSVFFLGMAKSKLEDCAGAIPLFERSLEVDATQKAPHYQLWSCHKQLGNADAAARHRAAYDSM